MIHGCLSPLNDIVRRVQEVLELLWGDRAGAIEQDACEILGAQDLREYFGRPGGFFEDHLTLSLSREGRGNLMNFDKQNR